MKYLLFFIIGSILNNVCSWNSTSEYRMVFPHLFPHFISTEQETSTEEEEDTVEEHPGRSSRTWGNSENHYEHSPLSSPSRSSPLISISSGNEQMTNDAHDGTQKLGFSSEDRLGIHKLAKKISHSKGIYREGDGKEIRRSILKKIMVTSELDTMRNILMVFNSEEDKLLLLEHMEYMVHQYDVAISFATMGGIKMISPLLFSSDDEIVSSVALVLGAAMQSNPRVQKIAADENICRMLLYILSHKSTVVVSRVVFALSSFLRNFPDAQFEFISENGVSKLADILKNNLIPTSTKLKIVDLFSDLALEQETTEETNYERKTELERSFIIEIHKFDICNHVASFLTLEDYDTHQRTIAAMLSLFEICHKSFDKKVIKGRLLKLFYIYHPSKSGHDPIYPYIDEDLKIPLFLEIVDLFAKVENSDTSFQHEPKSEL